jgi:hypothetical protein
MKKTTFLIAVALIFLSFAGINWMRYPYYFNGGIKVGVMPSTGVNKAGSKLILIDSITTDNTTTPTLFKFYRGATQLIPDIPASGFDNAADLFAPKYLSDTIAVTSSRNLALTDGSKWLACTKSTELRLRIPADSTVNFPIGTVINVSMDGAGIIHFIAGTGVVIESPKDSVCFNTQWDAGTLVKRAANKWRLIGPQTD